MQFGVTMFPTDYAIPPHELAIEAESRGLESVWFPEHSHIPTSRKSPWPGGAELPKYYYDSYDPFVAMGAAAVVTKTIKLGTGEDADAVARHAVHGRAQRLAPAGGDVLLVQAGQRFAAAEDIEEGADHAGVGSQQDETPFHDW